MDGRFHPPHWGHALLLGLQMSQRSHLTHARCCTGEERAGGLRPTQRDFTSMRGGGEGGSSSPRLAPSMTHVLARADVSAGEQKPLCASAAGEGGCCARQGCSLEGCSCFNPLLTTAHQPPVTLGLGWESCRVYNVHQALTPPAL